MPIILRAHTFTTFLPDWLDHEGKPTMPFREYNAVEWEPWMWWSYSRSTKPFTSGPESNFSQHLDPLNAAGREQSTQMALGLLDSMANEDLRSTIDRLLRWRGMSRSAKEALLLEIWEASHGMCERYSLGMNRAHAPECTLGELVGADGRGQGMEKLVLRCRPSPDFDVSTASVPIFHDDRWDRLWSAGKYEPAVPFSRAKRAAIELSIAQRAHYLLSFIGIWKYKMDGGGPIRTAPQAFPCAVNATTAPRLFAMRAKRDISDIQGPPEQLRGVKRCALCNHDSISKPGITLLCCERCKTSGRFTWYCSGDHQKTDWPLHKRICGTAVGQTSEAVGFPGK